MTTKAKTTAKKNGSNNLDVVMQPGEDQAERGRDKTVQPAK